MRYTIWDRANRFERRNVTAGVTGCGRTSGHPASKSNLVTRAAAAIIAALAIGLTATAAAEGTLEAMVSDAPGLELADYEIPFEIDWTEFMANAVEAGIAEEITFEETVISEAFEDAADETEMELGGEDGEAIEAIEAPAEAIEDGETGLLIETEEVEPEAEPVCWIEKIAPVEGRDYSVVVRYLSDSGIPADAILTATEITDDGSYAECLHGAQDALEESGDSVQDFFLLDVSLIADGVNYASTYRYEVEIVMNEAIAAQGEMRAMQFEGSDATLLNTTEDDVNRISFRPEAA